MTRPEFKSLITLAVKESFFLFDKIPYMQVDGVSMGSPLAPTLANIFLCHHEQQWLDNCPPEFKPLYFRRYVDDTFLVFNKLDHATLFLQYLNNQHPNIMFTMDGAVDGSLSFLDLNISLDHGTLSTEIFRKPTFSGLGISFFSHVPLNFKVNAITTLLHRAYHLSSSYISLSAELDFLRKFFSINGYPVHLFETQCKKFLSYIYRPKPVSFDVLRRKVYFSVPYYGRESERLYSSLSSSLSDLYPQFYFKFVPTNPFTIGSLFPYKDRVPDELRSKIIYQFSCESCNASYIGSTCQGMSVRVGQHRGISHRTNRPLATVMHSVPRDHAEEHNHPINTKNFTIINSSSNYDDLHILESLHIQRDKPNLINVRLYAVPLFITN
uniref:Reverse transcriptase domain-containing protein n=1 Tax=Hirondellea gigas TaxID=1518452 RepID=A0A6A7FPI6_9CRUS